MHCIHYSFKDILVDHGYKEMKVILYSFRGRVIGVEGGEGGGGGGSIM